jgi:cell shape-determining protein MreC
MRWATAGGPRTLSGTGDQFSERIDHVNDLQGHLLAIAHEVKDLRDRVAGIDQLQAELGRLRAERDELQDVLARIGALANRVRPGLG